MNLTSQHVTLQVLRVKVGLGTVGAREFSISILLRNGVALGRAINSIWHHWRTTRCTGQDASSSLRSHHMCFDIGGHSWHRLGSGPRLLSIVGLAIAAWSKSIETRARRSRSERLRVALTGWLLALIARVRWLLLLLGLLLGRVVRLWQHGSGRQATHGRLLAHVGAVSVIRSRRRDRRVGRSRSVARQLITVLLRDVVLVCRRELRVVDRGQVRIVLVGRHGVG